MTLPWTRPDLQPPVDPLSAQQLRPWWKDLTALSQLVAGQYAPDPRVQFVVHFAGSFEDERNGAAADIDDPVTIVEGRNGGRALRIERAASNLLLNPSFELDLNGWTTPNNSVELSVDSSIVYTGNSTVSSQSLKMLGTDLPSTPFASTTVNVSTGRNYSGSAWVRSEIPVEVQIQLVFSGGSGSTASSGPVSLLPQEWTRLEVHGASSGDNTVCEVRLWLLPQAPEYVPGSRVSAWRPTATGLANASSPALQLGDVVLASTVADPAGLGSYRFQMVSAAGPGGPVDTLLRLDGAGAAPTFTVLSRLSVFRPAAGDAVPVTDNALVLNAGDIVFCQLEGKPYDFAMVTTGATGASNSALRLNGDASPPDFAGTRLSRFLPDGSALSGSTSLALTAGDLAFCHLVEAGRYGWTPVTVGGTGPGDPALRLAGQDVAPHLATGSRLSFLTPDATALATDTSVSLLAGDALLCHTLRAPEADGYGFHVITTGGTGPADDGLRLDGGPSSSLVWIDCVQVEEGPYASSYLDYLQGFGYGGQSDSPGTRSGGRISYASPTGLSASSGAVGLWFRPNGATDDGRTHVLFDLASEEFRNRITLRLDVTGRLAFSVWDDDSGLKQTTSTVPPTWGPGEWVHLAVTWSSGTLKIYHDGAEVDASSSGGGTGSVGLFPPRIYLGSGFLGTDQADGLLADVFILNGAMSASEIDDIASSPVEYQGVSSRTQDSRQVSIDAFRFRDDFAGDKDARWTLSGAGGTYTQNSEAGGTGTLATGATSGNKAVLSFNAKRCVDRSRNPLAVSGARLEATTQIKAVLIGLYRDDANLMEIYYSAGASPGNYQCRCVSGSNETSVDTGIAADTDLHKFEFLVDDAGGKVEFELEDDVFTISTNVPSGLFEPRVLVETQENADKQLTVDLVYLEADR